MLSKQITRFFILTISVLNIILLTACSEGNDSTVVAQNTTKNSAFPIDNNLCQFAQAPCQQTVNGIDISLSITPESAPSEKPLAVSLSFSESVQLLGARVEGRDMFMGVIPLNLTETAESRYNGTLVYGSCSSNYMVWRMFVSFNVKGQQQHVMFDFLADNPPVDNAR